MTRFSEASPLKVSEETHRRVRLAAAVAGETMGSIVEIAVGEFMEAGADLLVANLDAIKAGQTPPYSLDEYSEIVRQRNAEKYA